MLILFIAVSVNAQIKTIGPGAIAPDFDQEEGNENRNRYVEDAVRSLIDNKRPAVTSTKAIGCTVKRAM